MHKGVGSHADDLRLDDTPAPRGHFALDRREHVERGRPRRILEIHGNLQPVAAREVNAQSPQPGEPSIPFANLRGDRAHVDALAVAGDRILAAGTANELADMFPRARRVDLGGLHVLPGFVDSHIHFVSYGMSLLHVDLRDAPSLSLAAMRVAGVARGLPPGTWVFGDGWDKNPWPEGRFPNRRRAWST